MPFQHILQIFFRSLARRAKANEKKKVLIDLSGNGGGVIMLAFQLFQIFFPDEKIYLGFRFRAHEMVDYFGQTFAHFNYSASYESGRSESNPLPYACKSAQTKSTDSRPGMNYTDRTKSKAQTSPDSSPRTISLPSPPTHTPINGYRPIPQDPATALFALEDIAMVTDGFCASTSTTFVKLMKVHP